MDFPDLDHVSPEQIDSLQIAIGELGKVQKSQTDIIHELKIELEVLKNFIHKEIVPIVNESRF